MKPVRFIAALLAAAAVTFSAGSIGAGNVGGSIGIAELSAGGEEPDGLSVSQTEVFRKGEFDLVMNVPPVAARADSVTVKIWFDKTAFEVTEVQAGSGYMINPGNANGLVVITAAQASVDLSAGLSYTIKVRVREDAAAGDYNFNLNIAKFSNTDNVTGQSSGSLWSPAVREAGVKVISRPVTGMISVMGKGGTATVSLMNGGAVAYTAQVELTADPVTAGLYTGQYEFDEADASAYYTVLVDIPGAVARTSDVGDLTLCLKGDVSGDGDIDAADATQILRYIVGLTSVIKGADGVKDEYRYTVGNVIGGGEISVRDATQILRHVAGYSSVLD